MRLPAGRSWHQSRGWLPGLQRAGPSAPLDEVLRVAYASVAYMDVSAHTWFSQRTSRTQDWPLSRLLAAKGDTTVSVVLPALNEAATVGRIVQRIRPLPVVDEVVVMDSGSTDATIEVAAAAGARVVEREDVVSHLAPRPGRGGVRGRS